MVPGGKFMHLVGDVRLASPRATPWPADKVEAVIHQKIESSIADRGADRLDQLIKLATHSPREYYNFRRPRSLISDHLRNREHDCGFLFQCGWAPTSITPVSELQPRNVY